MIPVDLMNLLAQTSIAFRKRGYVTVMMIVAMAVTKKIANQLPVVHRNSLVQIIIV